MSHDKPIHIIVACSENRVIAHKGSIPWRIKEDFQHLYQSVAGGVVIEGRKTYEDMGKAYPNTQTLVVSSSPQNYPDAQSFTSIEEAIEYAQSLEDYSPIWIGGGQRIYDEAFAMADKLYLTLVHTNVEGDTFFPDWRDTFTQVVSERRSSNAKYEFTFYVLERPH